MSKQSWKPGNMLYPLPVVMVSAADKEGRDDIITVAWARTVCTNPPMVSISIRPERYSYHMIRETGEFVINLTTEELAFATDYCGVKSGRDVDKFKETGLTREKAEKVKNHLTYRRRSSQESSLQTEPSWKEMQSSWHPADSLIRVPVPQVTDTASQENWD